MLAGGARGDVAAALLRGAREAALAAGGVPHDLVQGGREALGLEGAAGGHGHVHLRADGRRGRGELAATTEESSAGQLGQWGWGLVSG